jgi:hypothetical protein
MPVTVSLSEVGICLTRRGRVNGIKRSNEHRVERKRISLDKRKRIMRLGINIYSDNLEPGSAVA